MNIDRIDFISAYCDSWCERCAFTSRCSHYAIELALGMCEGNLDEAIQLAVGAPPPRDAAEEARREAFVEGILAAQPTEAELNEDDGEEEAREERLEESPFTSAVERFTLLASTWLDSHPDTLALTGDARLADAMEIAQHDVYFISAKLHRALRGHDEFLHGESHADDPVQNDWNGSAKVALISIRRSAAAWTAIAEGTGDADAMGVANELRDLRREAERAFPDAWNFIRPGFDHPTVDRGDLGR